ncbi:Arm DNA-binding domain-containing protein [Stakelama marina]|uniref:Arm DNA-binding domain-containing protein n=1 Tax=Stakelama marina TaxID=2826939 RepID=UPI0024C3EC0C|nr:Arm DNA-binding domain-containing protein [Stakelama marina]
MSKPAKRTGRLGDGDGLFLVISTTDAKSWSCRVQKHGRRDIGLGSASKVTLARARERAREVRNMGRAGARSGFREAEGGRYSDVPRGGA